MPQPETGYADCADVQLFYRLFRGPAGRAPLIIFHGANYYDSNDWIEVAGALAHDRDVLTWDARGFGASGWSPGKDYSYDAYLGDARRLMDRFGWQRAVIMGHSIGGSYALLFGARIAERTAAVVLVDHCPQGPGGKGQQASTGNKAKVYPDVDSALKDSSRAPAAPGSAAWQNFESRLIAVSGGVVTKRDPDFSNRVPAKKDWASAYPVSDMWQDLANLKTPALIVRGRTSDRFTSEALARLEQAYPHVAIAVVDSGHDVAGAASNALVEAVRRFLDTTKI